MDTKKVKNLHCHGRGKHPSAHWHKGPASLHSPLPGLLTDFLLNFTAGIILTVHRQLIMDNVPSDTNTDLGKLIESQQVFSLSW